MLMVIVTVLRQIGIKSTVFNLKNFLILSGPETSRSEMIFGSLDPNSFETNANPIREYVSQRSISYVVFVLPVLGDDKFTHRHIRLWYNTHSLSHNTAQLPLPHPKKYTTNF
jgi:hypothetical protein